MGWMDDALVLEALEQKQNEIYEQILEVVALENGQSREQDRRARLVRRLLQREWLDVDEQSGNWGGPSACPSLIWEV